MARGGYRPGSGPAKGTKYKKKGETRKKAVKKDEIPDDIREEAALLNKTPLQHMLDVMNDHSATPERRDRMAVAAAPFVHPRKGEGAGKKDEKADRAKQAGAGKFAAGAAPLKLVK